MAKNRKRKQPVQVWCPYCGRPAVLKPASAVYGEKCIHPESYLYVCGGYPECDAYVGVHAHNMRPKGFLADKKLRQQRVLAHRALDSIWKDGWMTRNETYAWLANKMGLREKEMHIGFMSHYYCEEVIRICSRFIEERKGETLAEKTA